jgi:hypothetical protein
MNELSQPERHPNENPLSRLELAYEELDIHEFMGSADWEVIYHRPNPSPTEAHHLSAGSKVDVIFFPHSTEGELVLKMPNVGFMRHATPDAIKKMLNDRATAISACQGLPQFEQGVAYNATDAVIATRYVEGYRLDELMPEELADFPLAHLTDLAEGIKDGWERGVAADLTAFGNMVVTPEGLVLVDYDLIENHESPLHSPADSFKEFACIFDDVATDYSLWSARLQFETRLLQVAIQEFPEDTALHSDLMQHQMKTLQYFRSR